MNMFDDEEWGAWMQMDDTDEVYRRDEEESKEEQEKVSSDERPYQPQAIPPQNVSPTPRKKFKKVVEYKNMPKARRLFCYFLSFIKYVLPIACFVVAVIINWSGYTASHPDFLATYLLITMPVMVAAYAIYPFMTSYYTHTENDIGTVMEISSYEKDKNGQSDKK